MAKQSKRPLAVFLFRNYRKIGDFIIKMKAIVFDIGNNSTIFVTPSPALATVTTDIDDLDAAETEAKARVPGAAAIRNQKYDTVIDDMNALKSYVQNLADTSGSETDAIIIINASGFSLKVNGVHVKPDLVAQNGALSGTVKLIAKAAARRASYSWQQSTNNQATWTDLPPMLQAKTFATGLTVGARVFFRYRPVIKGGAGNWSQSVWIIVQ